MGETTRVELHCHSIYSDGAASPEELAECLAAEGVVYAALADHDTVAGHARFRRALARRGMVAITGLELSTHYEGHEVHLLGYGFDVDNPELLSTLQSLRQSRAPAIDGIAHSLRHNATAPNRDAPVTPSAAPQGRIGLADAIALIHRAGGIAILAHPLHLDDDPERLAGLVARFKQHGLDGIEALYRAFTPEQQRQLLQIADSHGLLVTAGSDVHELSGVIGCDAGIDMPTPRWKAFRDAALARSGAAPSAPAREHPARRSYLRHFSFHIIVPTALAIALFMAALFWLLFPAFERVMLDRKREMIRELTNAAWGTLAEAHREERAGLLTRQQAQRMALDRIEAMRYGRDGKDYFWIQDTHPRILMHPYRKDLVGQDVSEYRDPRGVRIFVEFAELVRRRNEGYIEYVWQWKDDPTHLAPKESYVRGFEPWGWIIGTGLYIDDVMEEIARIEQNLVRASAAISLAVALLLLYVVRQTLWLERERSDAEEQLRQSIDRYRKLVEASTEGNLLVIDNRCRYANPIFLELVGRSERELELLDLPDLLPRSHENHKAWSVIDAMPADSTQAIDVDGSLRRPGGQRVACRLTLRRLEPTPSAGLIVMARPRPVAGAPDPERRAFVERVLRLPGTVATDLAREIAAAESPELAIASCRRLAGLVRSLLDYGAHPRHVTRLVASVCDAATSRFVDFATVELGPAPAPFAFVAMGSQGRSEQTLHTDQDNAIVYADEAPPDSARWFLSLGQRVCDWLNEAGYPYCRGDVMAKTPRWCQPLSVWRNYFSTWIGTAEPRELLHFSIFFDFRVVWGESAILDPLRRDIASAIRATPAFLTYLARDVLDFKAPIGMFGRLLTGGPTSEHPGMLDLKSAMMPIINFARLYALRHEISETNTLERLDTLARKEVIPHATHMELAAAYESLMQLRLRTQVAAIQNGLAPTNLVDPSTLGHIERSILRQSLTEIDTVQTRLNYDFLGGT